MPKFKKEQGNLVSFASFAWYPAFTNTFFCNLVGLTWPFFHLALLQFSFSFRFRTAMFHLQKPNDDVCRKLPNINSQVSSHVYQIAAEYFPQKPSPNCGRVSLVGKALNEII